MQCQCIQWNIQAPCFYPFFCIFLGFLHSTVCTSWDVDEVVCLPKCLGETWCLCQTPGVSISWRPSVVDPHWMTKMWIRSAIDWQTRGDDGWPIVSNSLICLYINWCVVVLQSPVFWDDDFKFRMILILDRLKAPNSRLGPVEVGWTDIQKMTAGAHQFVHECGQKLQFAFYLPDRVLHSILWWINTSPLQMVICGYTAK